jgi:hypothetical protein
MRYKPIIFFKNCGSYTILTFKLILLNVMMAMLLSNCKNCPAEPAPPLGTRSLYFAILDKNTNINLVPTKYHPDTIKLYDKWLNIIDLSKTIEGTNYIFGPFNFFDSETYRFAFNDNYEREYYLYLGKGDYDTLSIAVNAKRTKCEEKLVKFELKHNNSLNTNKIGEYGNLINLLKLQ